MKKVISPELNLKFRHVRAINDKEIINYTNKEINKIKGVAKV